TWYDSAGHSLNQTVSLTINSATSINNGTISLDGNSTLPAATVGQTYGYKFPYTYTGSQPYIWATMNNVPIGFETDPLPMQNAQIQPNINYLSISGSALGAVPTAAGTYSFSITIDDH